MNTKITIKRYNLQHSLDKDNQTDHTPSSDTPNATTSNSGQYRSGAPSNQQPGPNKEEHPSDQPTMNNASSSQPPPKSNSQPNEAPADPVAGPIYEQEIEKIRREGLSARQLRSARRLALSQSIKITSDFDAVYKLRAQGIDPFQDSALIQMISAENETQTNDAKQNTGQPADAPHTADDKSTLPETIKPIQVPSDPQPEENHFADIASIQRDIAQRRRQRLLTLSIRLFLFVFIPTIICGWYFIFIATPLYATKSEFVIQQADPTGGLSSGGTSSLLGGASALSSVRDSMTVQGYLQSLDAMLRLDKDKNFKSHFSAPTVDFVQRLNPDATLEDIYDVYKSNVKISFDPTEGIVRMEVLATNPKMSADFSNALISYAEEQVDHLTKRLREDQMRSASSSYDKAYLELVEAHKKVVALQEKFDVLSSEVEVNLITTQISQLETQLSQNRLSLFQLESDGQTNQSRVKPIKQQIKALEQEIATLRSRLTNSRAGQESIAQIRSELLVAQADVETRQLILAQSVQAMELARVEANRQVRYLLVSVSPIPPEEAIYPKAFANTLVAFLIFAGIYLTISMTVAILKEQVSS